jgi:hypothetical protein
MEVEQVPSGRGPCSFFPLRRPVNFMILLLSPTRSYCCKYALICAVMSIAPKKNQLYIRMSAAFVPILDQFCKQVIHVEFIVQWTFPDMPIILRVGCKSELNFLIHSFDPLSGGLGGQQGRLNFPESIHPKDARTRRVVTSLKYFSKLRLCGVIVHVHMVLSFTLSDFAKAF